METELRGVAEAAGLNGRVTFTGRLAHGDVRDRVAAMDVTVSPKATFYASPMKILEYMAVGKPVVAPAMGNIRDIIDDGRTGLLFTPDDADDLTRTLEALLASAERRRQLGLAARREIEDRLNWHNNARTVLATIEQLIRHPGIAGTTART
jgi:glycosyltransferase involved in cell wall biosynthesis